MKIHKRKHGKNEKNWKLKQNWNLEKREKN